MAYPSWTWADRGVDTQGEVVRELRGISGMLRGALGQREAFDAALQEGLVARQQFLSVLRQRATTECARHGDDWRALQQRVERELADASPEPTLAVSARVGDGSTPAAPGSEHRACALCHEQVWASPATLALKPDGFICTFCWSRSRPAPGAPEDPLKASAPAAPATARLRCCQFHELGGDERHGCGGDAPATARLRCCQFHGLGGDERHGCGSDALPRTGPRPRPPGSDGEGA